MLAACEIKAADVCKSEGSWPAVWGSARYLGSRGSAVFHLPPGSPWNRFLFCPRCDVNLSISPISSMDHVLVSTQRSLYLQVFPLSLSSAKSQIEI